ncbi:hypothetical protein POTOM_003602 [Populus tomentosa]|uniref:Uncharacterized protein n=1 Tax=Populus tomentosa TaxID=118781 RepID=A0A8X8AFL4_POPTO|nr:hypothetical protein POTOM_003602 [Populus tomentosa]
MPSTIPLFAAPAGLEEEETFISLIPLLVLLLDPLISFLTVPTPSSATDLHLPPHVYCSNGTVTKEMQKQKKRETDRRYRKNKKVNASLTSTAHLEFETIYTELEKEIECVRTENELTECLLNDPNTINI